MIRQKAILFLLKNNYYNAVNEAFSNENLSYTELKELQQKKLLQLIQHARTSVPFYSKLLKNINSLDDFESIPFLTKRIIKDNFLSLKSTKVNPNRFRSDSTSGSTGEVMKFFTDNKMNVVRHACAIRGDSCTGWNLGEPSVYLWGARSDTDKAKKIKSRIINSQFLFNTTFLSSFDMKKEDMKRYIQIINKKKPSLIVGYPSTLEAFSKFIEEQAIDIYSPKGIITGGETLYDYQRVAIEKVFRTKALNRYGCRDVGHIANECQEQDGLHISMDHIFLEVINQNGQPCKPGELGEIVVTDLDNYVFPFIRYKIGDVGVLSDHRCNCGRELPMLERVEGRTFDIVVGSNGNLVPGNYFTLLRHKLKSIDQFQIIQNKLGELNLILKINTSYTKNEEKKIKALFKEKLGEDMIINIEIVKQIPVTKSGKFRWIISNVSPFVK